MDHVWLDIKDRQDDECKVIVCGDKDLRARVTGVFAQRVICALGIHAGSAHLRPDEVSFIGAYSDIKIIVGALSKGFVKMKADNHTSGLIFNGWMPCQFNLFQFTRAAAGSPVAIQVCAMGYVICPSCGIADAEAGGVFND